MTPRLSGHFSIFGVVFFVLEYLLGIARKWSRVRELQGNHHHESNENVKKLLSLRLSLFGAGFFDIYCTTTTLKFLMHRVVEDEIFFSLFLKPGYSPQEIERGLINATKF